MIGFAPEAWKHMLQPKQIVHFVGEQPPYWQARVAGKWFKIQMTQQIPYERGYILAPSTEYGPWDISDHNAAIGDLGLYPTNTMTLYEILFGMKSSSGSVLIYPRFPPNEWFITLEEAAYIPNTANNNLRYIGAWTEELTPPDKPQVRMHTISKEESIGLMLYNDAEVYQKLIMVMTVNRCLLEHVEDPMKELTELERSRARELIHAALMTRGHWGKPAP